MSVDVIVARGQADKVGQDIIDVLVSETAVALKRGQNELDAQGGYFSDVSMDVPLTQLESVGDLLQFQDFNIGISWRGRVKSITHKITVEEGGKVTADTSFSIQRKKS